MTIPFIAIFVAALCLFSAVVGGTVVTLFIYRREQRGLEFTYAMLVVAAMMVVVDAGQIVKMAH